MKIRTYQEWEDHMIVESDLEELRRKEINAIKKYLEYEKEMQSMQ